MDCGGRRRYVLIFLVVLSAAALLYTWKLETISAKAAQWRPENPPVLPTYLTFPAAPLEGTCDGVPAPKSIAAAAEPIPNIVHYIWLLADPTVFSLDFAVFVGVYSAHLYYKPDRIYIHTDASPELWERQKTSGDLWTKRVLNLPGVTPNHVKHPRKTSLGQELDTFGVKSDIVRGDALREFGGVYLDTDAIPLRDIAPLRNSGFANVVGGQGAIRTRWIGYINTGVWLSRPHSNLAELYTMAMDKFYKGQWALSIDILGDLAFRLHAMPGEVLVMHARAFSPTSWEDEGQEAIFRPHRDTPSAQGMLDKLSEAPTELQNTCADALAWLAEREQPGRREKWELDFSGTYIMHAFDGAAHRVPDWDAKITLKYVLARQSNYARAVYPAIWHAVEAGIIAKEETV
jgi:hypothetical protein